MQKQDKNSEYPHNGQISEVQEVRKQGFKSQEDEEVILLN